MRALPGKRSPSGAERPLTREAMAEEQRRRILRATAELVGEHGYLGLRIEQLLEAAQVSLPTLRKRLDGLGGCYLALQEEGTAAGLRVSAEAFEGEPGAWPAKAEAAIGALFDVMAARPDVARACVIEPFAAGQAAIERYARGLQQLGSLLLRGAGEGEEAVGPSGVWAKAAAAAVLWLPAGLLLAGEGSRIPELAPKAAGILRAAATALGRAGSRKGTGSPTGDRASRRSERPRDGAAGPALGPLPSGRHLLARETVAQSQRERLLAGVADAVAARGFAATRVTDIVRRASVSRRVFYENFAGKEECFLAAWERLADHAHELTVEAAAERAGDPPDQIVAALGAFLGFLAAEPELARFLMVDSLAAGLAAVLRYRDAVSVFAKDLRACLGNVERGSGAAEALVGAVATTLSLRIAREGSERLGELTEELAEFLLAPYRGNADTERSTR